MTAAPERRAAARRFGRALAGVLLATGVVAYAGDADLGKLSWLVGCWRDAAAEPGSGEQWTPLEGGTMLGLSRTVKRRRTVSFEFMQIRVTPDGGAEFVAQPGGRPPTVFALHGLSDTQATFENPTHDFPQRVVYALAGPGELRARIEGLRNGVPRVIEFPMHRISCDAPPRRGGVP